MHEAERDDAGLGQAGELSALERMSAGDPAGLEALYDLHAGRVLALALRILRQEGDAEDTVQDVFAQAWRLAARGDRPPIPVGTWLLALARSRAIGRLRARQGRPFHDDQALLGNVVRGGVPDVALHATPDEVRRLDAALGLVHRPQRTALELAVFEGLTPDAIAAALNEPSSTIRAWLQETIASLHAAMRAGAVPASASTAMTGQADELRPEAAGGVAAGLWHALVPAELPAGLKARVLAVAGVSTTGADAARRDASAGPRRPGSTAPVRTRVPWWLPYAAIAAALALLVYAVQQRARVAALEGQLAEVTTRLAGVQADVRDARARLVRDQTGTSVLAAADTVEIPLTGRGPASGAVARAYWSRAHGLVLAATRLPDLPRGQAYQMWVLNDGPPVSAGTFSADGEGRAMAVFDTPVSLPQPTGLSVSVEPQGGAGAPSGDVVLEGTLRPAAQARP